MGGFQVRPFQFRVFRVIRVSGIKTRITHNNFGYRNLLPDLVFGFFEFGFFGFGFGFFGYGFRVSGNMPSYKGDPLSPLLFAIAADLLQCD